MALMQLSSKSPGKIKAIVRRMNTCLAEQSRRHSLFNSTIGEVLYQPAPLSNSVITHTVLFANKSRRSDDACRKPFAFGEYGTSVERIFFAKLAVFDRRGSRHRRLAADPTVASPSTPT